MGSWIDGHVFEKESIGPDHRPDTAIQNFGFEGAKCPPGSV
jgi:hypothetical protein